MMSADDCFDDADSADGGNGEAATAECAMNTHKTSVRNIHSEPPPPCHMPTHNCIHNRSTAAPSPTSIQANNDFQDGTMPTPPPPPPSMGQANDQQIMITTDCCCCSNSNSSSNGSSSDPATTTRRIIKSRPPPTTSPHGSTTTGRVRQGSSSSNNNNNSRKHTKEQAAAALVNFVTELQATDIHPSKLQACILSLRELTAGESGLDSIEFVHSGAFPSMLLRAKDSIHSPGCSEQACRFSFEICSKLAAARDVVAEHAAAKYFTNVMKTHMHMYASVTESAICALGSSCLAGHAHNMTLARQEAGMKHLLSAMRRWKECRSLQASALRAIEQTSEDNLENQKEIIDYGGIQEVVSTMQYFADDSRMQATALSTIIALAYSNDDAKDSFGCAGAIYTITGALHLFSGRLDIASYGSLALGYLCRNQENKERLAKEAGIEKICACMNKLVNRERDLGSVPHKDGIAHCLLALISGVTNHAANKQIAVAATNMSIILRSIWLYALDARIAEHGSELLYFLSTGPHLAESKRPKHNILSAFENYRTKQYGVDAVVDITIHLIIIHIKHVFVIRHTCDTLCNIINIGRGRDITSHSRFSELQSELRNAAEFHSRTDDVVRRVVILFGLLRSEALKV